MAGKSYFEYAPELVFNELPETGWRGIRTADDTHKARILQTMLKGIQEGAVGSVLDGMTTIDRGGVGTIKPYLAYRGLGALFATAFSTATITTPDGATLARKMTFELGETASTRSIASMVGRELKSSAVIHDAFAGGQIPELRMSQALGPVSGDGEASLARCEIDLDYVSHPLDAPEHESRTYPSAGGYYSVRDLVLEIGPTLNDLDAECLSKFDLKIPFGLGLDPTCIGPNLRDLATMDKPEDPTLALAWTAKNRDYYDAYLLGTPLAFRATWTGRTEIEEGILPYIQVSIPAFIFTGDDPVSSSDGPTTQELPGRVMNNLVDKRITVEMVTADHAF